MSQHTFAAAAVARPPGVLDDQATRLRAMVEAMGQKRPNDPVRRAIERRARVVTVSSGKGGVGKTNISVNMAIALAALGKRTTLLDADLGLANADVLCGMSPTMRLDRFVGVSDRGGAAGARAAVSELAVEAPGGFRLVPGAAGVARMAELEEHERARLIAGMAELERDADVLIVDTAAGLGSSVLEMVRAADVSLVVATPEPTSIADAYGLIKCVVMGSRAAGAPAPRLMLVVNQASNAREAEAVAARISGVAQRFLGVATPMLGKVAMDAAVPLAVRRRRPFVLEAPRGPASRDVGSLAARLLVELDPAGVARGLRPVTGGGLSGALSRLFLRTK